MVYHTAKIKLIYTPTTNFDHKVFNLKKPDILLLLITILACHYIFFNKLILYTTQNTKKYFCTKSKIQKKLQNLKKAKSKKNYEICKKKKKKKT